MACANMKRGMACRGGHDCPSQMLHGVCFGSRLLPSCTRKNCNTACYAGCLGYPIRTCSQYPTQRPQDTEHFPHKVGSVGTHVCRVHVTPHANTHSTRACWLAMQWTQQSQRVCTVLPVQVYELPGLLCMACAPVSCMRQHGHLGIHICACTPRPLAVPRQPLLRSATAWRVSAVCCRPSAHGLHAVYLSAWAGHYAVYLSALAGHYAFLHVCTGTPW
jgi:hypothetical protein